MATYSPARPMFEVEVHLPSREQGGWHGALRSGYRPSCDIGRVTHGDIEYNDARFDFTGNGRLEPGQTARAIVTPAVPTSWGGLHIGDFQRLGEHHRQSIPGTPPPCSRPGQPPISVGRAPLLSHLGDASRIAGTHYIRSWRALPAIRFTVQIRAKPFAGLAEREVA
jgi:hypothetical protein